MSALVDVARAMPRAAVRDAHREYRETRDPRLRAQLIESYMGLAAAVASKFRNHREPQDDLQQAAMVGLLKALDRYDPDRGVEFATYAWATITGELRRHFRDRTWGVHVTRRLQERYLAAAQALDELRGELKRSPTIAEVAAHIGTDEESVIEALEVGGAYRMSSLDAPVGEGGSLGATLPAGIDEMAAVEHRELLSPLLARLSERERLILNLRFVEDLTQSEIADRIGISQMHVSRLLARSLARLREGADAPALANAGSGD